ncbi:flavin reductase family protein [Streptomyces beihaiensis]|uniref:Flavin reductase family protein n=1 Tax=Streptomyces beihaiensis TaxID=2984495 RepID=A0ABT3TWD5_9ACTN|nr:flavin reductase family protein [Streptomyces beihaiensis]MCX3061359.1 flavin reductase family protein [Streptomyces beihaiensis]
MTPAQGGAAAGAVTTARASAGPPAQPPRQAGTPHRALRNTLGRYATGVAVVTARSPNGLPVAMTINSFTAVSLDPPLILWCLAVRSARGAAFTAATHFAVHVLTASQHQLATRFAGPAEQTHDLPMTTGPHRLPLLPDTAATLICRQTGLFTAGDHTVLLAEVESHTAAPGQTLLFADGAFHPGPSTGNGRVCPVDG